MKLLIDTNVILDMVLKRNNCDITMELNAFQQKWKDFEDCVQYTAGKNNRIDYIITSNQKDYTDAILPVLTPAACIEMFHTLRP